MKIEDIELASTLKYQLDELQAVMNDVEKAGKYVENSIHLSIYGNGERRHIPKATAEKIINLITSEIEGIKRDIETL